MAHSNKTFHTASDPLANSEIRRDLGEIPVPPLKPSEHLPAKLRRISCQNTLDEIRHRRRKRNKKQREKNKRLSKKEKKSLIVHKLQCRLAKQENMEIKKLVRRVKKERKRAVDFWRMWDKEKMLRTSINL